MIRAAHLVVAGALATGLLAGCGSSGSSGPAPAQATLAPPPATPPADFTSIDQLTAALQGVALCKQNGPMSVTCTLLSTTPNSAQIAAITPFQLKVFATPQQLADYLVYVRGANQSYATTGSATRQYLVGGHWIMSPQVDASGQAQVLQPYLGGKIES